MYFLGLEWIWARIVEIDKRSLSMLASAICRNENAANLKACIVLEVINKTYRLDTRNATPHRLESPDLQEYGVHKL